MKKRLLLLSFVVVLFCCAQLPHMQRVLTSLETSEEEEVESPEARILSMLSPISSCSNFTPALVYKFNPETRHAALRSSGTLFNGPKGLRLMTAGHVFHEDTSPSYFLVRSLRPLESRLRCVVSICCEEENIPGFKTTGTDVVLCEIGDTPYPINGFYTTAREESESSIQFTFLDREVTKKLRSVVSDQEVRVVGISEKLPSGLRHFLIVYDVDRGDSGSGFFDSKRNLYSAEAKILNAELKERLERYLGVAKTNHLAVVIGGYRPKVGN